MIRVLELHTSQYKKLIELLQGCLENSFQFEVMIALKNTFIELITKIIETKKYDFEKLEISLLWLNGIVEFLGKVGILNKSLSIDSDNVLMVFNIAKNVFKLFYHVVGCFNNGNNKITGEITIISKKILVLISENLIFLLKQTIKIKESIKLLCWSEINECLKIYLNVVSSLGDDIKPNNKDMSELNIFLMISIVTQFNLNQYSSSDFSLLDKNTFKSLKDENKLINVVKTNNSVNKIKRKSEHDNLFNELGKRIMGINLNFLTSLTLFLTGYYKEFEGKGKNLDKIWDNFDIGKFCLENEVNESEFSGFLSLSNDISRHRGSIIIGSILFQNFAENNKRDIEIKDFLDFLNNLFVCSINEFNDKLSKLKNSQKSKITETKKKKKIKIEFVNESDLVLNLNTTKTTDKQLGKAEISQGLKNNLNSEIDFYLSILLELVLVLIGEKGLIEELEGMIHSWKGKIEKIGLNVKFNQKLDFSLFYVKKDIKLILELVKDGFYLHGLEKYLISLLLLYFEPKFVVSIDYTGEQEIFRNFRDLLKCDDKEGVIFHVFYELSQAVGAIKLFEINGGITEIMKFTNLNSIGNLRFLTSLFLSIHENQNYEERIKSTLYFINSQVITCIINVMSDIQNCRGFLEVCTLTVLSLMGIIEHNDLEEDVEVTDIKENSSNLAFDEVLIEIKNGLFTFQGQNWSNEIRFLVSEFFQIICFRVLQSSCAPTIIRFCFEKLFLLTTQGLGDYQENIRASFTKIFKKIVPLAPLAKEFSKLRATQSQASPKMEIPLLDNVLEKKEIIRITEGSDDLDRSLVSFLKSNTNLLRGNLTKEAKIQGLREDVLRDYQIDGITWLTQLRRFGLGGILADEMGLGKSLQVLTALSLIRKEKELKATASLIICPASLISHWVNEISQFFPSNLLSPKILTQNRAIFSQCQNSEIPEMCGSDVFIGSYDEVRNNIGFYEHYVWEMVVLDEAHLIKNPFSKTAKSIFSLKARFRVGLTGTPVQNQVEDVWSLMNFIIPDYLGDYKTFHKNVVKPVQKASQEKISLEKQEKILFNENNLYTEISMRKEGKEDKKQQKQRDNIMNKFNQSVEISAEGVKILQTLHKQVLPFILRRNKTNVARELPPKTILDIYCPLSNSQKTLYEQFQKGLKLSDNQLIEELKEIRKNKNLQKNEISEKNKKVENSEDFFGPIGVGNEVLDVFGYGKKDLNPLQSLTYLRLLCSHPSLVIKSDHLKYKNHLLSDIKSSTKMTQLIRLLLESGVMSWDEVENKTFIEDIFNETVGERSVEYSLEDSEDDFEEKGDEFDKNEINEEKTEKCLKKRKMNTTDIKPQKKIKHEKMKEKINIMKKSTSSVQTHRCLIFAQHKVTLDLIENLVLKRFFPSVKYDRLDSSVTPKDRANRAYQFNQQKTNNNETHNTPNSIESDPVFLHHQVEKLKRQLPKIAQTSEFCNSDISENGNSDIRLLLMTTRSCGLGLNLSAADTVIFFEHDWNPFIDMQAMDRAHRLGQKNPVTVFRLLAESTVEARVMSLQNFKQNVANQIINEDNSSGVGKSKKGSNFGSNMWNSLLIHQNGLNNGEENENNEDSDIEGLELLQPDNFLESIEK